MRSQLRNLAEQAAARAVPPPVAELRRRLRVRRRRIAASAAGAALVIAAIVGFGWPRPDGPPGPELAPAAPSGPTMSAVPTTVVAGGSVLLSGASCDPDTEVLLTFGVTVPPVEIGHVRSNVDGSFVARVRIPPGTPAGPTVIWSSCLAPDPAGKLAQSVAVRVER